MDFSYDIAAKGGSWSSDFLGTAWLKQLSFAIQTDDSYLSSARNPCEVTRLPGNDGVRFTFPSLQGELRFVEAGGGRLLYRVLVRNTGESDLRIRKIWPLQHDGGIYGPVQAGPDTRILTFPVERSYGADGPQAITHSRTITSYWQVAAHDPASGIGFLAGVAERARTFAKFHVQPIVGNDPVVKRSIQWSCELDCHSGARGVRVPAGGEFDAGLHEVRVWQGGEHEGLEAYAEGLAQRVGVNRVKIPNGWCSWYAGYFEELTQDELEKNCAVAREIDGLDYMLIDGGWWTQEIGTGKLGEPQWNPAKFPQGMRHAAESIAAAGLTPGLHMRPWEGWQPRAEGLPDWAEGASINLSRPEALEYLRELCRWVCGRWGYRMIKIDFLAYEFLGVWGNALPGDFVTSHPAHDDSLTNAQIYVNALTAMREGAGPDVFIIGCNSFHGLSYGLVDANRMGDDVSTRAVSWDRTFQMGVQCVAPFQHLNGRVWANDPDCLLFQAPMPFSQARLFAAYASLAGQAALVSSKLYELDGDRTTLMRACLPSVSVGIRPLDVFQRNPASVLWGSVNGRYLVGGFFNWTSGEAEFALPLAGKTYVVSEFFTQRVFELTADALTARLEAEGCAVYAIHERPSHPAVVGTDSHLLQGLVEIGEATWDAADRTLSLSAARARPAFQVAVYLPAGFTAPEGIGAEDCGAGTVIRVPLDDGASVSLRF